MFVDENTVFVECIVRQLLNSLMSLCLHRCVLSAYCTVKGWHACGKEADLHLIKAWTTHEWKVYPPNSYHRKFFKGRHWQMVLVPDTLSQNICPTYKAQSFDNLVPFTRVSRPPRLGRSVSLTPGAFRVIIRAHTTSLSEAIVLSDTAAVVLSVGVGGARRVLAAPATLTPATWWWTASPTHFSSMDLEKSWISETKIRWYSR